MTDPVLFLPGMMCDARLFAPQIAALSQDRMIAVAPLRGATGMADLARQILDRAPPRFALAGLSMGGICAMEMIRQAPERISRLALLDTSPLADPAHLAAVRDRQVQQALSGALDVVMRDEMKPHYLTDGPGRQAILDLCMDMAMALGPEVFASQSIALRDRPDQCETLASVSVPTLILCGADDRLCPVKRHTLMHELIPGSELQVLEGAGHLPTLELPDETTAALKAWLAT